ncbi:AraC-like DNA-binding protein [Pontibacter ummariensis]|uniref:AraC-type DNA-binding protein n=1 Tax=Pontibacter ummariensis TaxID=1610492 RepID=A0A239KF03_9BACT|nr:helix-turn-helix domain-containing protein [Pontibacter ummariensis]PRY06399.1 AraC-like DNA-binding protein [Pontibacter ummariensis]SNT16570.1 AraC-type DNA-binding protein [Pontibacter ummariensis]
MADISTLPSEVAPMLDIKSTIGYYLSQKKKAQQTFGMNKYESLDYGGDFAVLSNEGGTASGPPIKTDHYALILCLRGSSTKTVGQFTFAVQPQTVHLVSPGVMNSFENSSPDLLLYMLLFKREFLDESFISGSVVDNLLELNPDYPPVYSLDANSFNSIKGGLERISEEFDRGAPFHLNIIRLQTLQLLYEMNRACEVCLLGFSKHMNRQYQLTHDFRMLVEENFLTKRTVSEYADLLNISAKHLSESVKRETGESALEIIHRRLLREAQYLLSYSSLSIKEIALHLRFDTASHFSRFFKLKTGLNPSQYGKAIAL